MEDKECFWPRTWFSVLVQQGWGQYAAIGSYYVTSPFSCVLLAAWLSQSDGSHASCRWLHLWCFRNSPQQSPLTWRLLFNVHVKNIKASATLECQWDTGVMKLLHSLFHWTAHSEALITDTDSHLLKLENGTNIVGGETMSEIMSDPSILASCSKYTTVQTLHCVNKLIRKTKSG